MSEHGSSDLLPADLPPFPDESTGASVPIAAGASSWPWATDALIWPPDFFHERSAWIEHIPFAFWITQALRPRRFVELGTDRGVSYLAFCQAVERLGLATSCFAVDTWKGDEHAGFYGEEVFGELNAYHQPRYTHFSRLVRSTFDEAVAHFDDASIDLLHIDGLHTYEAVKHDFETWQPKLATDAVVLFHDVNVRERGFGVFRLWQELAETYPSFTFLHGHGLGVLGVGSHFPPPLAALFAAGQDTAATATIRRQFSRFGDQGLLRRVHALAGEVAGLGHAKAVRETELMQQISAKDAQVEHQRQEAQALSARLQVALANLAKRDAKLAEYSHDLQMFRGVLQRVDPHDEHAAELSSSLAEGQATIARLQAQVAQLAGEHAEQQKTLKKLRQSASWKLTRPWRAGTRAGRLLARRTGRLLSAAARGALSPLRVPLRRSLLKHQGLRFLEPLLPARDRRTVQDVWLLRGNPWFNGQWYLQQNAEVRERNLDPVEHYVRTGARKGRNPGPGFDNDAYLKRHRDVAATGANPLAHFIRYGFAEGRRAVPASSTTPLPTGMTPGETRPHFSTLQPLRTYLVPDIGPRLTLVTDGLGLAPLSGDAGNAASYACLIAARLGSALRVITRSEPPDQGSLNQINGLNGVSWKANVDFRYISTIDDRTLLDLGSHDLFLATSWWTAWSLLQSVNPNRILYLVQQDERLLYPVGDEHLVCGNVMGNEAIRFIVSSRMLYEHLTADGLGAVAKRGCWFEPAFPASQYFREPSGEQRRNLLFYSRPDGGRNLYELGLAAINLALQRGLLSADAWNIHLVGQHEEEGVVLAGGLRPILHSDLDGTAALSLMRRADLGLCLTAGPHPGIPALALAACGAAVVTDSFGRKTSLGHYSANIACIEPAPEALAQSLGQGAVLAGDEQKRRENAANDGIARDCEHSFDPVLRWLMAG